MECQWFHACHNGTEEEVFHPVIGWTACCDSHIKWLQKDTSPTKFVPPLVARKLRELDERTS